MATYYHGNADLHNGGDGLPTLILMNPSYIGVNTDSTQPTSNQESPTTNNSNNNNNLVYLPHAPPHFLGFPPTSSQEQDAAGLFVHMVGEQAAREHPHRQRGLSLSLSSVQRGYSAGVAGASATQTEGSSGNEMVGHGNQGLSGSKYIRAAQELLDEAVNIGTVAGVEGLLSGKGRGSGVGDPSVDPSPDTSDGEGAGRWKRGAAELSTAERQEIQMKKAKLVDMLDEVELRYRQYHNQMNMVILRFEQVAGLGSAKSYTALALRTISKQFRCLKDAILNQIKTASKSLGEKELDGKIKGGGSRLKYVDNQIRQQRALQQLGMVQHNAWRPQRGLPERAVSVLRAWLFEHFLHPYPKDSDKITLAKQTGLTRSQVSNWFINARVRLWKPMVEEMYVEEMKDRENKNVPSSSSDRINEDSSSNRPSNYQPATNKTTFFDTSNQENPTNPNHGFNLIVPSEIDCSSNSPTPKKLRIGHTDHLHHGLLHSSQLENTNLITSMNIDLKQPPTNNGFTLMGAPTDLIMGGFGPYPVGPEASFHQPAPNNYSGNGVSLTLGLPHCENNNNSNISIAASTQYRQGFIPRNNGVHGIIAETSGMNDEAAAAASSNVRESINNIQDDRKRFIAQLFPDFVS